MNLRNFRYHISESFPAARLCLCIAVIAFAAVVSTYRYIDLAGLAAIAFSCYEAAWLVISDSVNLIYIFLPLYVFLVCGIMFDNNFGAAQILKCGSRGRWFLNKYVTFLFYTVLYFLALAGIILAVCSNVFPGGAAWSRDFVNLRVMLGQSALDFAYSPLQTIGLFLAGYFLYYMMVGSISMLVSLLKDKEPLSLAVSLAVGIVGGLLWDELMEGRSAADYARSAVVFLAVTAALVLVCLRIAKTKDIQTERAG